MIFQCENCDMKFTELERLERHRQVHGRKSKIKEYGEPTEINYYKQGSSSGV